MTTGETIIQVLKIIFGTIAIFMLWKVLLLLEIIAAKP
jgi:hypothetical protein